MQRTEDTASAGPEGLASADLVGARILQFLVVARLGQGGMGVVYKAIDEKLRRPVALKVLGSRYLADERNKELIFREARSAAAVSHPNVAAIHDVSETDDIAFIVMELVEGRTLRERIAEGPIGVAEVLHIAREIARGLDAAHRIGVVHRDLKPDNIMLTRDGRVKLLDFGLAKLVADDDHADAPGDERSPARVSMGLSPTLPAASHTRVGRVVGTPAYMPPEQARGEAVDARADVFAFGIVLYEMLTGVSPFARRTGVPSGDATSGDWNTRGRVGQLIRRLPRALETLVHRCLALERDARSANGAALVTAIESIRPAAPRWRRYSVVAAIPVIAAGAYFASHSTAATRPPPTYHPRRVTTRGDIKSAQLAPDGHTVAALAGGTVVLLDLEAPDNTRVLATDATDNDLISWSSDGKHLIYDAKASTKVIALDGSIVKNIDDHHPTVAVGAASYATWLLNAKAIHLRDVYGDGSHDIRCPIPGTYLWLASVTAAAASDDIYVTTRTSDTTDSVYRTDRTCSHVDVIATALDLLSTAIAADGSSLLGIAGEGDRSRVVVIDRDGSHDLPIRAHDAVAGQRSDGTVVLVDTSVSWRLIRVARDGAIAELASGATHNAIDVSPDGRRFARLDTTGCRGGPLAIVDFERPSEAVRTLETTAMGVAWAPDNRRLAVLVATGAARALVIEDVDGNDRTSRAITDLAGDGCDEGLELSWIGPDEVAYHRAGNRTYRRVELASGPSADLFDASRGWPFHVLRSPAGPALVVWWNRAPTPGLWLVEPGREDRLLLRASSVPVFAWSPAGDAIYTTADTTTVERIDLPTGATSPRATLPAERNVETAGLFVRPDGDLIMKRERRVTDLVTETPSP